MIDLMRFEGHEVRVLVENGDPLFCAADVCRAISVGNVSDAMGRLADDEKTKRNHPTSTAARVDSPPVPPAWYVTEPGVYALIMESRTPESVRFKRWVTHEVLPSIRKTGGYSAPAPALDLRDPAALRGLLAQLAEVNLEQQRAIADLTPPAQAWRVLGGAGGLVGLMQAGKQLHQQERLFVRRLVAEGFLYRDGDGTLVPYARFGPTGSHLFEVRTWTVNDRVRRQTFVTAKGIQALGERLAASVPAPASPAPLRALPGGSP